jgi:hypothetical protein
MPATINYKEGYPSTTKPFESSAAVGPDGLVTGSATFLLGGPSNIYMVDQEISPKLFSSLIGIGLSGLFVESRSMEKRGGLWTLRVNVVGAINPPIIERAVEISPRSFNKTGSITIDGEPFDLSLSFDYLAETTTATTVTTKKAFFEIEPFVPKVIERWNVRGVTRIGLNGIFTDLITANPRILTNETTEQRSGIVRVKKSAQFVFE